MFEHGELSETSLESKKKEPILARYVKKHHAPEQIIRDQTKGIMKMNKLKGTCLLSEFEPRTTKDALNDESWIVAYETRKCSI